MYSKKIIGFDGQNPFGDYQGSHFSNEKVYNEFCPISTFWTLFNNQHEIILGTRGSGKTFLLKMMRLSMLKNIQDVQALKYVSEKSFIALYIPMHLEFITSYTSSDFTEKQQILLFQIAFNCLVAQSLIFELRSLFNDLENKERYERMLNLVKSINDIWFGDDDPNLYELDGLAHKINRIFYNLDYNEESLKKIPTIFKKEICSALYSVKEIVEQTFNLNEPTWIVCVDEAEFLTEPLLRCINNVFRSDSHGIALKIATLPFYYSTLETLQDGLFVSESQDFNFRVVDMESGSQDFINLTNKICQKRLVQIIPDIPQVDTLEEFLGRINHDDLIDYYKLIVGEELSKYDYIEKDIINNFSNKRKENANNYPKPRKTIYDKFAPIYFIREVYKIARQGHNVPGWFAGAKTIRKVSQGNPRLFIHLMNMLFNKAQKTSHGLTLKAQHEVVCEFSKNVVDSTIALEAQGPMVHARLNEIAKYLHKNVHEGPIISVGSSFVLQYRNNNEFNENLEWLKVAIAHSRIIVEDDIKKGRIKPDSYLCLAPIYAVVYWLPMRKDISTSITLDNRQKNTTYLVETVINKSKQISFFEDYDEN